MTDGVHAGLVGVVQIEVGGGSRLACRWPSLQFSKHLSICLVNGGLSCICEQFCNANTSMRCYHLRLANDSPVDFNRDVIAVRIEVGRLHSFKSKFVDVNEHWKS